MRLIGLAVSLTVSVILTRAPSWDIQTIHHARARLITPVMFPPGRERLFACQSGSLLDFPMSSMWGKLDALSAMWRLVMCCIRATIV
jgi:hypothetical protein